MGSAPGGTTDLRATGRLLARVNLQTVGDVLDARGGLRDVADSILLGGGADSALNRDHSIGDVEVYVALFEDRIVVDGAIEILVNVAVEVVGGLVVQPFDAQLVEHTAACTHHRVGDLLGARTLRQRPHDPLEVHDVL